MGSLFGGGSDNQAKTQQQQYFANQRAITAATGQINNDFAGFNPSFYQGQYNNLVASMEPQEQQQFRQSSNDLGFKLADQGLGKSSQAKELGESLTSAQDTAQQNISNAATEEVNSLKQNVNQAQSNLIGEASVANDPGQVSQGALQTASGFQSPVTAQPIGDLFQNWANIYLAGSGANSSATNASNAAYPLLYGGVPSSTGTSGGYGGSFMNSVSTAN